MSHGHDHHGHDHHGHDHHGHHHGRLRGLARLVWLGRSHDAADSVDADLTLREAHRVALACEARLAEAVPGLASAVVHAYPRAEDRAGAS